MAPRKGPGLPVPPGAGGHGFAGQPPPSFTINNKRGSGAAGAGPAVNVTSVGLSGRTSATSMYIYDIYDIYGGAAAELFAKAEKTFGGRTGK